MKATEHSSYESSNMAVAIRDIIRVLILSCILWSVHTLNNIDKDTSMLKYRMDEIEKRMSKLEQLRTYDQELRK